MAPEPAPAVDRRAEIDELAQATLTALRAPSILNSQPWRWRTRGRQVELWTDPDRRLAGLDPTGRLLLLSCGAALHHALAALAAAGHAGDVTRLPADGPDDLVARLGRGPAVEPDRTAYEAIYRRRTDRRPFTDRPPTDRDLRALRSAARRHGVRLRVLPAEQVPAFAAIVAEAGRAEEQVAPFSRDVVAWSDRARATGDGVALRHVPAPGPRRVPLRDFAHGRPTDLAPGPGTDGGTAYAVLMTRGQERADWLAAGEALSDVWLTLTARGLAASPISEVIEVPQARAELHRLLGWTGHPAIAVRFGHSAAEAPPPSARRSSTDVVGLPGDP